MNREELKSDIYDDFELKKNACCVNNISALYVCRWDTADSNNWGGGGGVTETPSLSIFEEISRIFS